MEFFLPGIIIFLSAITITYLIVPHFTPLITIICSILFLTFGVYHHQQMFAAEYRLSTWQDGLKIYAPAVMILAICLFMIYSIVALFTDIKVPIPTMPEIEMPNTSSLTNSVMNVYNNVNESISNAKNNISKTFTNTTKNMGTATTNQANKTNNGISRSALETI
jgi:predicted PurR-regulated permease PerM